MPKKLRTPLKSAVQNGVNDLETQFDGAIDSYVDEIIDTGKIPPLTFSTTSTSVVK